jgi:hypothetical protein
VQPIASWTYLILVIEVVDARRNINKPRPTAGTSFNVNDVEQGGTQMKFEDIKFKSTDLPQGIQAMIHFGDYQLSIIQNEISYGNKNGLYEIAVFKDDGQIEMPGITQAGDTVKGFLSESDVEGIIKKMHLASGADPEQI